MFTDLDSAFSSVPAALLDQVYLVGGAVRDSLLGLAFHECDWVLVGVQAQQLLELGFVEAGPGMPVYLHPQTGEEYALARRERKTGPGYHGFVFDTGLDVTLTEDLKRRDFTVNAMALSAKGELIDPFDGQADIGSARLRHVSGAFVEDPLRILRAARFAAKLGECGFRLAHATHALMRQMVTAGAVAEWQPQRTGEELLKAMQTAAPWRFFEVLQATGALACWLPCLAEAMQGAGAHRNTTPQPVRGLQRASRHIDSAHERLAVALLAAGGDCRIPATAAQLGQRFDTLLDDACEILAKPPQHLDAADVMTWLGGIRAWQDQERFAQVYRVLSVLPYGEQLALLPVALEAALQVDASRLKEAGLSGKALGVALKNARLDAIHQVVETYSKGDLHG